MASRRRSVFYVRVPEKRVLCRLVEPILAWDPDGCVSREIADEVRSYLLRSARRSKVARKRPG